MSLLFGPILPLTLAIVLTLGLTPPAAAGHIDGEECIAPRDWGNEKMRGRPTCEELERRKERDKAEQRRRAAMRAEALREQEIRREQEESRWARQAKREAEESWRAFSDRKESDPPVAFTEYGNFLKKTAR